MLREIWEFVLLSLACYQWTLLWERFDADWWQTIRSHIQVDRFGLLLHRLDGCFFCRSHWQTAALLILFHSSKLTDTAYGWWPSAVYAFVYWSAVCAAVNLVKEKTDGRNQ